MSRFRHPLVALGFAVVLTVPWLGALTTDPAVGTIGIVVLSGVAILGSSFLLAWAAETAEKDVPRSFAIAVLAVLAVAPEYAVDALYAWNAGVGGATADACAGITTARIEQQAGSLARACHDANLAIANMTGANRILIGIGWAGIALFTIRRAAKTYDPSVERRPGWMADVVNLDRDIATELTFLLAATGWAFLVPLGGGIGLFDTLFLLGLYVVYIALVLKSDVKHAEHTVGVPQYLQKWPRPRRLTTVVTLFAFSGVVIFLAVEPFAHGLEDIGIANGIPEFFMIQWVAPLASEAPELIVVTVLVMKARSTAGFTALVSSKLNQWTLLVGTIAIVYSLGLGQQGTLPFDARQGAEIWITAGQSLFALAILCDFEISVREAVALLVLFSSQVVVEFAVVRGLLVLPVSSEELLYAYTAVYVVAAIGLFVVRRQSLALLLGLAGDAVRTAVGRQPVHAGGAD